MFLLRTPDDDLLIVVVEGDASGGNERANIAQVVLRRVIVADFIRRVEALDGVRLVDSDDGVFLDDVERGKGFLRCGERVGGSAENQTSVDRVVRRFNRRMKIG